MNAAGKWGSVSADVELPQGQKVVGANMQWDHGASATPNAQLTFFAEFLTTTGVYDAWVDSCPLSYTSPNAHSKRDVLGTWLLAKLAGHNRYAHITGLRGDTASPLQLPEIGLFVNGPTPSR